MTYRIATVPYLDAWPLTEALDELAPGRVLARCGLDVAARLAELAPGTADNALRRGTSSR